MRPKKRTGRIQCACRLNFSHKSLSSPSLALQYILCYDFDETSSFQKFSILLDVLSAVGITLDYCTNLTARTGAEWQKQPVASTF